MNRSTTNLMNQLTKKFPQFFPYKVMKNEDQTDRVVDEISKENNNIGFGSEKPQIPRFVHRLLDDNNDNTSL